MSFKCRKYRQWDKKKKKVTHADTKCVLSGEKATLATDEP